MTIRARHQPAEPNRFFSPFQKAFQGYFKRYANRLALCGSTAAATKQPIENAVPFKIESEVKAVPPKDLAKVDISK
jgi:hypothetical protein